MKSPLPLFAALAVLALPVQAIAQDFDVNAAQEACQDDVYSLCGDAVPDQDRIQACLRKHMSKVSAKCRTFMATVGKPHRNANAPSRQQDCNSGDRSATSC